MSVSSTSSLSSLYATSSGANASSADQVTNPKGEMDKNSFLKMLVTKLENQDPLSVDDSDFTTEMAQYSQVESSQNTLTQVTSMAAQLSNLNTNTVASLSLTNTAQAVSLIGKTVKLSVTDSTTNVTSTITGTVSSVAFVNGTPEISVNGTSYSLSDVTEVSA